MAISVVLGTLDAVYELEKVDDRIVSGALRESVVLSERYGDFLASPQDDTALVAAMEGFLRERRDIPDGHFVEVEIYDSSGNARVEAVDPASVWRGGGKRLPHKFEPDAHWYAKHVFGTNLFIQVITPLPKGGAYEGYFEGIYQVAPKRLREIVLSVSGSVVVVIVIVLLTTIVLYPVIRTMNRQLVNVAMGLERALREAQDANAATRAKSAFLATMSHELRTPLNGVIATIELLKGSELSEEQGKLVGIAEGSAATLLSIIGDVLDFSKIEAGHLDLEVVPFSPRRLVAAVENAMSAAAKAKKLTFGLLVDPAIPKAVVGDPTRLGQVLFNLVGNAIKFTERGEVRLSVTEERRDESSSWLKFAITDTGIGLNADQLSKLFTPFQQADNSTTRRFGGTGLGLSICRLLVERMGGRIDVASEPGKGSTFSIVLPLVIGAEDSVVEAGIGIAKSVEAARPPPSREEAAANGSLILVVEDNATNRQVIRMQLARLGYAADAVENGRAAVEAWRHTPYAMILMDLHMPEMDGPSAAAAIRAAEAAMGRRVPIVALTATALAEDRKRCLDAGMDEVLLKPVALSALDGAISRHAPRATFRHAEIPALDAASLRETFGVLDEWAVDALVGMPATIRPTLDDLDRACRERDGLSAKEAAHGAKGAARMAGASELANLLGGIEKAADEAVWDEVEKLIAKIPDAVKRYEAAVANIKAKNHVQA